MTLEIKEGEFTAAVAEGLTLVDFYAEWCRPCAMQSKILAEEVEPARPALKIAKIDIDACPALAAEHGILSIPALRLYRDGKAVASFDGLTEAAELLAAIDKAGR